jgi:phage shock protein A
LLAAESDPRAAILSILREVEAGVAGANRSVATATSNQQRIGAEIDEHRRQILNWQNKAREELSGKREAAARRALMRKREVEDLVAGLEQQLTAAVSTREQLETTRRALEARLAEARRLQERLLSQQTGSGINDTAVHSMSDTQVLGADGEEIPEEPQRRDPAIEDELDALRRELGQADS